MGVTVRNPVEGEGIAGMEVMRNEDTLLPCILYPAEFREGARYLSDDFGNVAVVLEDDEGTQHLYIVQSIDLDFS